MNKMDNRYKLINIAKKSDMTQKLGCVILKGNKIISKGYNRYTCKLTYNKIPSSLHAESMAIYNLWVLLGINKNIYKLSKKSSKKCFNIKKKYILYVGRILKNGSYGNAKPCKFCMEKINICNKIGIKLKVIYTNKKGVWKKYKFN